MKLFVRYSICAALFLVSPTPVFSMESSCDDCARPLLQSYIKHAIEDLKKKMPVVGLAFRAGCTMTEGDISHIYLTMAQYNLVNDDCSISSVVKKGVREKIPFSGDVMQLWKKDFDDCTEYTECGDEDIFLVDGEIVQFVLVSYVRRALVELKKQHPAALTVFANLCKHKPVIDDDLKMTLPTLQQYNLVSDTGAINRVVRALAKVFITRSHRHAGTIHIRTIKGILEKKGTEIIFVKYDK